MIPGSQNYRGLIAWQKAMDFVDAIYKATTGFPREEVFGLTTQLRRAVVSVPSNIAEGQGRASPKEFLHFLSIAHGSLREAETQVTIASRLGYLDKSFGDAGRRAYAGIIKEFIEGAIRWRELWRARRLAVKERGCI